MAAYEILLLNTAIPQIQAAQSGDTYVVPRDIAFSTVANLANGTYLLPSLTFSSDPDTGVFRQGANALGFTAGGGADQMVLTSTGLGIGTNSPAVKLEVVAPSGDNVIALFRSGDATAANNAGGGFRSISSATAASRVAQVWLDADGANFSGGDYFYIQKNGNSGTVDIVQYSNSAMTFATNATERARITSGGVLDIGTGAGAVGQIQFPATQVASSNANTLDDYEEGTWTPTFIDVTYTPSTTYTAGKYTKIGRVVTVVGVITTDALDTTDASQAIIGGLPFTVDAQNESYTPAALFVEKGFNASGVNGYQALASPGTTNINLYTLIAQSTTDNYGPVLYNQLTNGSIGTRIRFQITYIV